MKVGKNFYRGCMLGGAAADAKAYDVREAGLSLISDNTQLSSFTLDGLVWADDRALRRGVYAYIPCLFYSYQKWYLTQTGSLADPSYAFIKSGEILEWEQLFARRGRGETTVNALASSIGGKYGTIENRINNESGCGALTRVAPIGLYFWKNEEQAFRIGARSAALTHGHTDAILSAGFFAAFIAGIVQGETMRSAAEIALRSLRAYDDCENVLAKVEQALSLAKGSGSITKAMEKLGAGFKSDEAVAIATLLCVRNGEDYDSAVRTAASYKGNKDSIAPITGNAIGLYLGEDDIPQKWLRDLELDDLIRHGSDILLDRVDVLD